MTPIHWKIYFRASCRHERQWALMQRRAKATPGCSPRVRSVSLEPEALDPLAGGRWQTSALGASLQMVRAPGVEAVQAGHCEQMTGAKHRGQEIQEQIIVCVAKQDHHTAAASEVDIEPLLKMRTTGVEAGQEGRRALMEREMAFALSLLRQLLRPRRRWI